MQADMRHRCCVITGATSGIGLESARALAERGADLLLIGRDPERTRSLADELNRASVGGRARAVVADLASLDSVRSAGREIVRRCAGVHVLINNCGIWNTRRQLSEDGIELTWAVNVLSHHVLTLMLLERMRESRRARIVNIASTYAGNFDLDDVEFERRRWRGIAAYRQSKLALRVWTWALAERLGDTGVTANAVHPGGVYTGIYRSARGPLGAMIRLHARLTKASPREGADTPVWVATAPELENVSGRFWSARREILCPHRDAGMRDRVWELLERQAGHETRVAASA